MTAQPLRSKLMAAVVFSNALASEASTMAAIEFVASSPSRGAGEKKRLLLNQSPW